MSFIKTYFSPAYDGATVAAYQADALAHIRKYDGNGKEIALVEIDVGHVEIKTFTTLNGDLCSPAEHVAQRLEMHPHASDHPDAPLVRFMPGHEPEVHHYCPTGLNAIKSHLAERGEHGLHPQVMALLKSQLCHRDDIDATTCRNMGMGYAEIAALPKFQRAKHKRELLKRAVASNAARLEADALTAAANDAAHQAMILKTTERHIRHRDRKNPKGPLMTWPTNKEKAGG